MRHFNGFLLSLLVLAACAAPLQPVTAPATTSAPEMQAVTLDGTVKTGLLASTWADSPNGSMLYVLDPASGTPLPGYEPISIGDSSLHAFSPDRQTLAIVGFPKGDNYYHNNGSLLLIDLPTWQARRFELELDGWTSNMVFSSDGKRLAITHGETNYNLTMVDVGQGSILAQTLTDSYVTRLQFTESGEALMLYRPGITPVGSVSSDPPQVLLLDAKDLRTRWSAELVGVRDGVFPTDETITQPELYEPGNSFYLTPGLVFAPNEDTLYVVHADSEQLTTVDFHAQKVETIKIQPKLSWFERLLSLTAGVAHAKIADGTLKQAVISPDGQFLYIVGVDHRSFQDQQGNLQMEKTPLGLDIIQTRDGSRVGRFDTDAAELSLSPDGRFLYLRDWGDGATMPWTEVFDTASRELIARKDAFFAVPAPLMNGQFLLASTYVSTEEPYREQYHMSVLQPSDLRVLAEWTGSEFIHWLTP
jgi:hypothetical protein